MERLQKVIASAGIASRRKAEELITSGCVCVNGKKVTELGVKVSASDAITVNGKSIKQEDKVYYLLNKPRGYVTTVSDNLGRKTVIDLIEDDRRIYPVGRLDYDTTGILLLTNDGDLANYLMHPSKNIEKTYVAKLNKAITTEDIYKLKKGVLVDDKKCTPTKVKIKSIDKVKDTTLIEVTIVEGRNHIVKRMFQELGYLVDKLTRTNYAFLTLDGLKSGEYRQLSIKEVKRLYGYNYNENSKTR